MSAKREEKISFRLDPELVNPVGQWLEVNRSMDRTALINMAVRAFITQPQTLAPVEVVTASVDEMMEAFEATNEQYKYTMEKLK